MFVGGAEDRARLAELWPVGSIPVLVDGDRVLGESTAIVEHVTPALAPGVDARMWDRVIDGQVMTPMQKIVADSLRPEDARDPYGVDEARATLDRAYALLDDRLHAGLARRPSIHGHRLSRRAGPCSANVVHRWDQPLTRALTPTSKRLKARPKRRAPDRRGPAMYPRDLSAELAHPRGLERPPPPPFSPRPPRAPPRP